MHRPKFFLYMFIIFAIFVVAVAGTISLSIIKNNAPSKKTATNLVFSEKFRINDIEVLVALAKTKEEQELGLSFQKDLAQDRGLLFVFDGRTSLGIWMKDMNFPIDVIWFDKDFRVVLIKNDFLPNSFPEIIYSPKESRFILEVPAGFTQKHLIGIGDRLEKVN